MASEFDFYDDGHPIGGYGTDASGGGSKSKSDLYDVNVVLTDTTHATIDKRPENIKLAAEANKFIRLCIDDNVGGSSYLRWAYLDASGPIMNGHKIEFGSGSQNTYIIQWYSSDSNATLIETNGSSSSATYELTITEE